MNLIDPHKHTRRAFLKRSAQEAQDKAPIVIKPETSEALRFVMRLNAEQGTARGAQTPGYFIGGKTGTAQYWRGIGQNRVEDNHAWFIGFALAFVELHHCRHIAAGFCIGRNTSSVSQNSPSSSVVCRQCKFFVVGELIEQIAQKVRTAPQVL